MTFDGRPPDGDRCGRRSDARSCCDVKSHLPSPSLPGVQLPSVPLLRGGDRVGGDGVV